MIFSGKRLPPYTTKTVFSAKEHSLDRRILTAILNTPGLKISDENGLIDIASLIRASAVNFPFFHPFKIHQISDLIYAVRGGYVGVRLKGGQGTHPIGGNGETNVTVQSGSDGVVNGSKESYWTDATTPDPGVTMEAVSVGNSGDFGVSSAGDGATFTLDSDLDGDGGIRAGFWIEVTDAGVAEIKCRMWASSAGATGRTSLAFPYAYGDATGSPVTTYTNPTKIIIPIGQVLPRNLATPDPNDLMIQQFISGHVIRNHRPGVVNSSGLGGHLGPAYWRGVWDADDTEGLADTYFYDGEEVTVTDEFDFGAGSVPLSVLFVHVGIAQESSRPTIASFNANWRLKAGPGP